MRVTIEVDLSSDWCEIHLLNANWTLTKYLENPKQSKIYNNFIGMTNKSLSHSEHIKFEAEITGKTKADKLEFQIHKGDRKGLTIILTDVESEEQVEINHYEKIKSDSKNRQIFEIKNWIQVYPDIGADSFDLFQKKEENVKEQLKEIDEKLGLNREFENGLKVSDSDQRLPDKEITEWEFQKTMKLPKLSEEPLVVFPKKSGKLNVLLIIDVWGWAFDFGAKGIQRYSSHNCIVRRWNDVSHYLIEQSDVIFFFCPVVWDHVNGNPYNSRVLSKFSGSKKYIVGMRASPREAGRQYTPDIPAHEVACVSKEAYSDTVRLLGSYNPHNTKVRLVYSGIDAKIFTPSFTRNRFIIGWAGAKDRPTKRTYLLQRLGYPVSTKTEWGNQYFVKDRNRKPMVNFYHGIDVYVSPSLTEGFPQTVLEAMSCQLPVVSTAVGAISDVIDKRWLVKSLPESVCIEEMKERLEILKSSSDVRLAVGKENRQKILKFWHWEKVVKKYDDMFEGI